MELDPGWVGPLTALGLAALALLREALRTWAALVVERERQATAQAAIRRLAAGWSSCSSTALTADVR